MFQFINIQAFKYNNKKKNIPNLRCVTGEFLYFLSKKYNNKFIVGVFAI